MTSPGPERSDAPSGRNAPVAGSRSGGSQPRPEGAPRLWRSLEQLAGAREALDFLERELPAGIERPPAGVDRRAFVQLLGATLSLAGLAACRRPVEKIVPFVTPTHEVLPGIPKHYATTLPLGLAGYGLLVESHEGRPTKIEGNELHPATRGAASAQMQAAILGLYDPDRSRHVLQRTGGADPAAPPSTLLGSATPASFERKGWPDFVAAWTALEASHLEQGGAGLAVLAPASSSPTLHRLAAAARERFPSLRWVTWEPVNDENALAGSALVAGRPLLPVHDAAAARVLLSLDADCLFGERDAVAFARGFAAGRRPATPDDPMNRLWVVESALTTTGAMADHRLALPSGEVASFALALAAALESAGVALGLPPGLATETPPAVPARWLAALAGDLAAHRGRSLVVAGRDQPPAMHAFALAVNLALGNLGTTLALRETDELLTPSTGALVELVAAMRAGEVSTLLVLGGNPVYDAPADLGFADALTRVAAVAHLGPSADETALAASWHLPEAHFLESWGDCRAVDGTASVVQPLIAPLFDGHTAIELAQLVATGAEGSAYDAVRTTWSELLAGSAEPGGFEGAFRRVLHDGLLGGSASPPAEPPAAAHLPMEVWSRLAETPPRGSGALELVFRPSAATLDGRHANVGWLQELPDAITKMTWGNAAHLAPATAERLRLENEKVVRLRLAESGDAAVELPVWIVPGQAEDTVVVHLGYGRRAAGRVGTGVGSDVYPLRRSDRLGFAAGATLEPTGARARIAQTQDHGAMAGEDFVREAAVAVWRRDPRFAADDPAPADAPASRAGDTPQWAMAIDLSVCTGCNACVVACQSENNVPIVGSEQVRRGGEMHWLRVDRYYSGAPEAPQVSFQPVPCMHCESAPCEPVCPVGATLHTEEGLNAMVYKRCVGARTCASGCPYKVRRYNFFDYTKDTPELLQLAASPEVTVRSNGVMEKCTYCVQRIEAARVDAKLAGRSLADGDVRTACQQTCPTDAIVFGDLADPDSRVGAQKRSDRGYLLLAERGTRPRTSYLARIRNPHPELGGAS